MTVIPAPDDDDVVKTPVEAEEESQGFLIDAFESVKSFGQGLYDAATGEGVELEFPEVDELTNIDDGSIGFWESFPVNIKLGLVRDDNQKAEVLKGHFEGDERFGGIYSDKFGHSMMVWNEKPYYINKPGLTKQDLTTFLGEIAKYLPATRFVGKAKTGVGTIKRGVPAYTGTEIVAEAGERVLLPESAKESGADIQEALTDALTVGGVSAVVEAALPPVGRAIVRGAKGAASPVKNVLPHISSYSGRISEAARSAVPAALRPEAKEAQTSIYPLTQGQKEAPLPSGVTPKTTKLIEEEDVMRQAASASPEAGGTQIIRGFDDVQLQSIRNDAIALQDEFGSGAMSSARSTDEIAGRVPVAAAEDAQSVVTKAASDLKARSSAGYKAARLAEDAPVMTPEGVVDTATRMRNSVFDSRDGLGYTRAEIADMPLLARELKSVSRAVNIFSKEGARDVPLNYLHGVQKRLNRAISSADAKSPEGVALIAMKRELDGAITRGIDEGFMVGNPQALQQLKEATGLYSMYLGLTGAGKMPKGPRARAAAVLQKMSDQDYTALELANTLFGHSKFNPNQSMRLVIQQLKKSLPEDQYDEVISYLKDGILEKAFTNPKGEITRRAIVNNYNDVFIKNKQIVDELFSPEEIARITKFRKDVFPTLWAEIKLNPSGSGYVALSGLARAGLLSTSLRAAATLPIVAEAAKASQTAGAASRAREAVRQYTRRNQNRWITVPASGGFRTLEGERTDSSSVSSIAKTMDDETRRKVLEAVADQ